MMLTLYGLPISFSCKDVRVLIRSLCKIDEFVLNNLMPEGNGLQKIRVGLANESEGNHLMKCLNGFQVQGCVLRVMPFGKSLNIFEGMSVEGYQRNMMHNQQSYGSPVNEYTQLWASHAPQWQANTIAELRNTYEQQQPQNQSYMQSVQQGPQLLQQGPGKVLYDSWDLRQCDVRPNPVELSDEYIGITKVPGRLSPNRGPPFEISLSNQQTLNQVDKQRQISSEWRMSPFGRKMSPGRRISPRRRITPDRRMSPERRISHGQRMSPSGRKNCSIRPMVRPRNISPSDRRQEVIHDRDRRISPRGRHMSPCERRISSPDRSALLNERHISPPARQMPLSARHISPMGGRISPSRRRISPLRRPISPMGRRSSSPRQKLSSVHLSPDSRFFPFEKNAPGRGFIPQRYMPIDGQPLRQHSPDVRRSSPRRLTAPPSEYSPSQLQDKLIGKYEQTDARSNFKDVGPVYDKASNELCMYSEKRCSPDMNEAPPPPVWPRQDNTQFQKPYRPQYFRKSQNEELEPWQRKTEELRCRRRSNLEEKRNVGAGNWKSIPNSNDRVSPHCFAEVDRFARNKDKFETKHMDKYEDTCHPESKEERETLRGLPCLSRKRNSIRYDYEGRNNSQYIKDEKWLPPGHNKGIEIVQKRDELFKEIDDVYKRAVDFSIKAGKFRKGEHKLDSYMDEYLRSDLNEDVSYIESVNNFNARHKDESVVFKKVARDLLNDDKSLKRKSTEWNMGVHPHPSTDSVIYPMGSVPPVGVVMNSTVMVPIQIPEYQYIQPYEEVSQPVEETSNKDGYSLYLSKDDLSPFMVSEEETLKTFIVDQLFKVTQASQGWSPDFTLSKHNNVFRREIVTRDEKSRDWLLNLDFSEFKFFNVLINTPEELWYVRAAIWLPGHSRCKIIEPLTKLKLQNKKLEGVDIDKWKLVKKIITEEGVRLYVDMPPASTRALKKCKMMLSYELQKVSVFLKADAIDKDVFDAGLREMSILRSPTQNTMPSLANDPNVVKFSLKRNTKLGLTLADKVRNRIVYNLFRYLQEGGTSKTDFVKYGLCQPGHFGIVPENDESRRWICSLYFGNIRNDCIVLVGAENNSTRYIKMYIDFPKSIPIISISVAFKHLRQGNRGVKGLNFSIWENAKLSQKNKFSIEIEMDLESVETISKKKFKLNYGNRHTVNVRSEYSSAELEQIIKKFKPGLSDSYDVANMDISMDL